MKRIIVDSYNRFKEYLLPKEVTTTIPTKKGVTMQDAVAQIVGKLPNLSRKQAEKFQSAVYQTEAIEAAENVAGFEADRIMAVYDPSKMDPGGDTEFIEGVIYAARNAVLGVLARESIPGEYFDSLVAPWVEVVGELDLPVVEEDAVEDGAAKDPDTPEEEAQVVTPLQTDGSADAIVSNPDAGAPATDGTVAE